MWRTLPAVLSIAIALAACEIPQGHAVASKTPASETRTAPAFVSIDIWPPGPRQASAFMLSTWVYPFTHGHADFYGWDGSFLRTLEAPGNLLASVDGHYFVNFTTGELWSSTGELVRAFTEPTLAEGSTSLNWAADGDYLCGLESSGAGFMLVVEDVAGNVQRIQLNVPSDLVPPDGLRAMGITCSLTMSRAVVFGGSLPHVRAVLMSLPDGHPLSDYQLGTDYFGSESSPNLRWLAATHSGKNGWSTEVVDLSDGTPKAQLDGYFATFTPDSEHLVGTDGHGAAAVVDWRTKTALWNGPGHLETVMAQSDPATNMMLLQLSVGSTQRGPSKFDYWIVNGQGSGRRFKPRDCASIEASPTRVCWFV
jgi:hypothetical protein